MANKTFLQFLIWYQHVFRCCSSCLLTMFQTICDRIPYISRPIVALCSEIKKSPSVDCVSNAGLPVVDSRTMFLTVGRAWKASSRFLYFLTHQKRSGVRIILALGKVSEHWSPVSGRYECRYDFGSRNKFSSYRIFFFIFYWYYWLSSPLVSCRAFTTQAWNLSRDHPKFRINITKTVICSNRAGLIHHDPLCAFCHLTKTNSSTDSPAGRASNIDATGRRRPR